MPTPVKNSPTRWTGLPMPTYFAIDWATGQLKTKAALDKEERAYAIPSPSQATDPAGLEADSDTVSGDHHGDRRE